MKIEINSDKGFCRNDIKALALFLETEIYMSNKNCLVQPWMREGWNTYWSKKLTTEAAFKKAYPEANQFAKNDFAEYLDYLQDKENYNAKLKELDEAMIVWGKLMNREFFEKKR